MERKDTDNDENNGSEALLRPTGVYVLVKGRPYTHFNEAFGYLENKTEIQHV